MKAAYHTLGCKVNQYETEVIREQFENAGFETVSEDDFADVYIINTCTVTHLADRKSRQYIRRMKRVNPGSIIAVTGCYAQVSAEEVAAISEVDIVAGTNRKSELLSLVQKYMEDRVKVSSVLPYEALTDYVENDSMTSMEGRTRAFIKIQEGCDRFCSYCIIPHARGRVRSRSAKAILSEAEALVAKGYQEIVLTGINTALYGTEEGFVCDVEDNHAKKLHGIEMIIYLLNQMDGTFRIRLSSLEPTVVNAGYVKGLLKYGRLCHHMHLSIQSGSDSVIRRMNRHYTAAEYMEIVSALREEDPWYGITTDLIVGFPGETEDEFSDSLKMVQKAEFLKVHAFQYSRRKETPAAEMEDQIAAPVKKERSIRLMNLAEQVGRSFMKSSFGTVRTVLFEEFDAHKEHIIGYTDNYIRVYVNSTSDRTNEFWEVRLTGFHEDGAIGELISRKG